MPQFFYCYWRLYTITSANLINLQSCPNSGSKLFDVGNYTLYSTSIQIETITFCISYLWCQLGGISTQLVWSNVHYVKS